MHLFYLNNRSIQKTANLHRITDSFDLSRVDRTYIIILELIIEHIIIYKLTSNCFAIKPKYKCYKSKII